MKSLLNNRWLLLALRLVFSSVFAYAGVTKLTDPQAFADSIASFRLVSTQWINLMAIALPPLEIGVAVLIVIGWKKRAAAFTFLFLCGVFLVALSSALARGLQIDCGCFGSHNASASGIWVALGRDLLLCIGAVILYRGMKRAEQSA
jgi:putative oxidoreductase